MLLLHLKWKANHRKAEFPPLLTPRMDSKNPFLFVGLTEINKINNNLVIVPVHTTHGKPLRTDTIITPTHDEVIRLLLGITSENLTIIGGMSNV